MKGLLAVFMVSSLVLMTGCNSIQTKAFYGDGEALRSFLAGGGDIEAKDEYGLGFLESAVKGNNFKTVEILLKAGANVNAKNKRGDETPIFQVRSLKMADLLIRYGADLTVKNHGGYGDTPFQAAASNLNYNKGKLSKENNSRNKAYYRNEVELNKKLLVFFKKKEFYGFFAAAKNGDLDKLNKLVAKGYRLRTVDAGGNTVLHYAAMYNRDAVVSYLISMNMSLSTRNKKGQTALDLVKAKKNKSAKLLSCKQNSHCYSVANFEKQLLNSCSKKSAVKGCLTMLKKDIHAVFVTQAISERMSAYAFNNACQPFSYKKCKTFSEEFTNSSKTMKAKQLIQNYIPRGRALFTKYCGATGSLKKCKKFAAKHTGLIEGKKVSNAMSYLAQKCRLKENGWIYKSSQCRSGLAHGVGQAVNKSKNLSFKGRFVNGKRVKGEVLYDGQPMFDGKLSNGRPNGIGFCYYKGEPEKCEFYKGKRVDVLYKQRMANAEEQRKRDAQMVEMKRMQQQQNNRISQMQGQVDAAAQQRQQQSQGRTVGQEIGDYAMRKAGEKVMDKLFDKLF
ncbi:MAG: ankyrin repeat domain-containing protein [Gammaproteobacteria bacterium]|nr:ankyrin repeat domain-containing protein [Gammaproteobacteria bacterium]